jgi:hypothetical protein
MHVVAFIRSAASAAAAGNIYEGGWRHSKKSGECNKSNCARVVSTAVHLIKVCGVSAGQGSTAYINGDIYEGQYEHGQPHGQGSFTYVKQDLYETYNGEFKNGKYDGFGVYRYFNGDEYAGQWRAGLKHGTGEIVYAGSGERSLGHWEFDDCVEDDEQGGFSLHALLTCFSP